MENSNITIPIAFAAGVASFLSPCVLPLVPGYVSLISGVSIDRLKGDEGSKTAARRAVIVNSIAFNVGLSMIFLSLGAAAGLIGSSIISNPWVRIVGGLVIIAFGLQLIGILKIGALYKDTRFFSQEKPRGFLGSFTLGLAFAAGWTPCIGPILGGIIGLAATSGGWKSGLLLSSFYAAGLALPFMLTGLGINQFLGFYSKFRKHLHKVEVFSGVVLIFIGVLIMSNRVTMLASSALLKWIPNAETWVSGKAQPAPPVTQPPPTNTAALTPAPDFEFQTLDGKPLRLSDLRGQVVVLNFWATWCIPCKEEIPALNALHKDWQDKGLKIVGASWSDTADKIQGYQKEIQKFDYTVVTAGEDVQSKYESAALPTTYIIDRAGRIRQKFVGGRDRAWFEANIKPLIEEAPTTAQK